VFGQSGYKTARVFFLIHKIKEKSWEEIFNYFFILKLKWRTENSITSKDR
jgi:hypothetical protein